MPIHPDGPLPLERPISAHLFGPRVELRWLRAPEDVDPLAALVALDLEHLRPFMDWIADEPLTFAERHELLLSWVADAENGMSASFGCFVEGELIGTGALHRKDPSGRALELGYWLGSQYVGHGYATELALVLSEEAFEHDEIEMVLLNCDDANEASAAVAARAGFTLLEKVPNPGGATSPGMSGLRRCHTMGRQAFDTSWRKAFA